MGEVSFSVKSKGEGRGAGDLKDIEGFNKLKEAVNGGLDQQNFEAGAAIAGRWYTPKIIAAEETRENTAFGKLATADEIAGVVMPPNGLIALSYQAEWKRSGGEPKAAIFLGSNQLKAITSSGKNAPQEALCSTANDIFHPLFSAPIGVLGGAGPAEAEALASTGQALGMTAMEGTNGVWVSTGAMSTWMATESVFGSLCLISAAAGTYNISVQFKAPAGGTHVTVRNRALRVFTLGG